MSVTDIQTSLLELKVKPEPGGTSEARIEVRWCVTPQLSQLIVDNNIANPYLLLVVRPYTSTMLDGVEVKNYSIETDRYFVPLTAEMEWVAFSRPGQNSVFATIVWEEGGGGSWYLKRTFLSGYDYWNDEANIFDQTGDLLLRRAVTRQTRSTTYRGKVLFEAFDEITVNVPDEMYAKERPQWQEDFVHKFWTTRAKDECRFKERLIALLVLSPFIVSLAYLARTMQLIVGVAFGLRGLHLRSFAHPLQYGIQDVAVDDNDGSIWWVDKEGRSRPFWRLPFNPVTPLLLALVIFGVSNVHVTRGGQVVDWLGWGWWQCLGISVALHLVPFVLAGLIMALAAVGGAVTKVPGFGKLAQQFGKHGKTKREKHDAELKAQAEQVRRELEQMMCTTASSQVSLDALPKRKQTFHLRYMEAKNKRCKVYSR